MVLVILVVFVALVALVVLVDLVNRAGLDNCLNPRDDLIKLANF